MSRSALSLADRLRAFAMLQPADDVAGEALRTLTQSRLPAGAVPQAALRAAETPAGPPASVDLAAMQAAVPSPPPRKRKAPSAVPATRGRTRVTPLPREPLAAPLAAPGPVALAPAAARSEPPPIIAPQHARALLAPLAATPVPGRQVDVRRLVAHLAEGRGLQRLPLLTMSSTRRGAQLLVDCGAAMAPLRTDVDDVSERLRQVIGADRLQMLFFAGCPTRGVGPGARDSWRRWRPPPAGVPVIVVSELGAAHLAGHRDASGTNEWLAFAARARDAGCRVTALVPYAARRIAPALAATIVVLPWSERLDAGRVRRVLRDARRERPA